MRHLPRIAAAVVGCSALLTLAACGTQNLETAAKLPDGEAITKSSPYYEGAQIFDQRCSGCHTLSAVGAHGSARLAKDKEPSDGPNFNERAETRANVLYAIRNGGFSGAIMPQNLVTGSEAEAVADFLAKYAGADAEKVAAPTREVQDDPQPLPAEEGDPVRSTPDSALESDQGFDDIP